MLPFVFSNIIVEIEVTSALLNALYPQHWKVSQSPFSQNYISLIQTTESPPMTMHHQLLNSTPKLHSEVKKKSSGLSYSESPQLWFYHAKKNVHGKLDSGFEQSGVLFCKHTVHLPAWSTSARVCVHKQLSYWMCMDLRIVYKRTITFCVSVCAYMYPCECVHKYCSDPSSVVAYPMRRRWSENAFFFKKISITISTRQHILL